jgi:hypothetical protein
MRHILTARLTAVLFALSIAAPALAQSTMVRGKVIDAKKEGLPGVTITIESLGGSNRKLTTKTDRKGEFVQLLTESGMYRITASDPKIGSASNDTRVVLGKPSEMVIVLVPSTSPPAAPVSTTSPLRSSTRHSPFRRRASTASSTSASR